MSKISHNIEKKMKETLLLLVMFWNLENYFSPFSEQKIKFWNWKKFEKKRDDIAKTIMLSKEEYNIFPAIIGVCEVENLFVLRQLTQNTPLARLGYKIIHKDSPDKRGIDVALLYRKEIFSPLSTKFFHLYSSVGKKDTLHTRLILYTKAVVNELDTLHILVNHWPSKLGGEKVSLPKRMVASNRVLSITDSIFKTNPNANVILMGDFNDTPYSESLENLKKFKNLATEYLKNNKNKGSHKHKAKWSLIDQFLVSGGLYLTVADSAYNNYSRWLYCKKGSMSVFAPEQLLVKDATFLGYKVKRTYQGPKYLGGVSDHLPIFLKIYSKDYR